MNVHEEIKRVEVLLEDAVMKESYVEAYGALRMAVLTLAELVEALHQEAVPTGPYSAKINTPQGITSPGNDG